MNSAQSTFLEQYSAYVSTVLKPTQQEVKAAFDRWRDPLFWAKYTKKSRLPVPSPIQRVHTRIKRPESVLDKISRKPKSFPDGLSAGSFRRMNDALAGRMVTYFLSALCP